MKVKANISFSGLVTMAAGEVAEISKGAVLDDLLSCGYATEVKAETKKAVKSVENKRNNRQSD